ncbi:MAG: hypothetical protein ACYTHK_07210, partial [Planctomycetota bacterium]
MTSPTSRSLALLRDRGAVADVVERWIPAGPGRSVRRDLFNFGDIIAVEPDQTGAVIVQTTSGANLAARRKKILDACHEQARAWLAAGNR